MPCIYMKEFLHKIYSSTLNYISQRIYIIKILLHNNTYIIKMLKKRITLLTKMFNGKIGGNNYVRRKT
ncbi:hypothetical protein CTM_16797 [Clostridium tetanomorphum DSM 665]|nr:hypothetical protein CTM_16797 [Clostridium tetanomorphum DSM 665]